MIGSKIAIFIDTNVFEKKGFNFDARNQIIGQYQILTKNKNFENVCVSVVDNEIKQHINKKIDENKKGIKKHCKWLYNCLDEAIIDENINKDLLDYEKFKQECETINIDLKNINPELVMEKYFKIQYPFELTKPNEFKDAFFLEAVYKYAKEHELYTSFIVITNDNGIKNAVEEQGNKKIITLDSIEQLIDTMIKYPQAEKTKVFDYISSYDFAEQIEEMIKINISDIEEEQIDIDSYECSGIFFPKIIKASKDKIIIVCDMNINLIGKFSCLDYNNSYYSNEESEYLYKQYIERDFLGYVCQTIIEVNIQEQEFISAKILDLPEVDIDYESFMSIEDYFEQEKNNN